MSDATLKVTFFLFAYNQAPYIEAACRAALAQTYAPMEIILSDDCSSDGTFEIMQAVAREYRGPNTVILNQNTQNLGLVNHVNRSFELASGDLIVVAAGDDISLPERTAIMVQAFIESQRRALVLHSSAIKIDETDAELGIFIPPVVTKKKSPAKFSKSHAIYLGATGAWSRTMHQQFGPIAVQGTYEDLVFGYRAFLENALLYIDQPLVKYRMNVGISAKKTEALSFKAKNQARIKKITVMKAVYQQRLLDLEQSIYSSSRKNSQKSAIKISLFFSVVKIKILSILAHHTNKNTNYGQ